MIESKDSDYIPTMAACEAFENVINCVKTSNLNFCLQLSPFSANISIKKTLVKDKSGSYLIPPVPDYLFLQKQKLENIELAKKVIELESTVQNLTLRLEESVSDSEQAYETIQKLENKLLVKTEITEQQSITVNSYIQELEKKSQEILLLRDQHNTLQDHTASLQGSLQRQGVQIEDLQRCWKTSNSVASKLNKELNKNRLFYKKEKELLAKEYKSKIKYWRKNLGSERAEKIKVERKLAKVENLLKIYSSKNVKSTACQTSCNLDTPYAVTDPLPPIFSSQLCHTSKPINLTNSLPNLSSLMWVRKSKEEELADAAEQALNAQYDRRVSGFYRDAKSKAAAIRKLYDEGAIRDLFEENEKP